MRRSWLSLVCNFCKSLQNYILAVSVDAFKCFYNQLIFAHLLLFVNSQFMFFLQGTILGGGAGLAIFR